MAETKYDVGGGIPRGSDYLTTIRSDQYIELSAEMLGKGMDPYSELVALVGIPLNPPIGNTDTIMERLEDAEFDKEVPTLITAFANMSAAPIRLEGKGRLAGYYDLYVTLSPSVDSRGVTVYHSNGDGTGTFESKASFWPLFELRPLGGGESIYVDTGKVPVPGFPMSIGSAGGAWSLQAPTPNAARSFRSRGLFYVNEVIITATRENQLARVPLAGGPATIAKCAKIQAEFVDAANPGRLARINLGLTKPQANLESE